MRPVFLLYGVLLTSCSYSQDVGDLDFESIQAPNEAKKGSPVQVKLAYSRPAQAEAGPVVAEVDDQARRVRFRARVTERNGTSWWAPMPANVISRREAIATFTPGAAGDYLLIAPIDPRSTTPPGPGALLGQLTAQIHVTD